MELLGFFHMIWSAPLQIALSMYFLWQIVGASSMAGLGVMILMIPLNGYIAKKTKTLQGAQMGIKDGRVKEINEVLNGVKVIKLYAWERPFEAVIQKVCRIANCIGLSPIAAPRERARSDTQGGISERVCCLHLDFRAVPGRAHDVRHIHRIWQ